MKVDMVVMRHSSAGACVFLQKNTNTTVINAGDGAHEHPTQALLDAFTLREKLGDLQGKKILIVGDILHSRVALSNILCLKKMGAEIKLCGPSTLMPRYAESLGVSVEYNLKKALAWADAVNMLRIQLERQNIKYFPSMREYTNLFQLNTETIQYASKPLVVMHPGPINRGIEITSEIADGPHSVILEQVENGVAVRMAVLYLLAGKINA
jgi:aspartate carbamoyltransferase catalytic subunit